MLFSLIYVSSARKELPKAALLKLLESGRERNERDGITGLLLYKNGNIMQVLEGEKDNVMNLFCRIERDRRHRGVIVLLKRDIEQRCFGDWTMGFRDMNDPELHKNEAFNGLLNSSLEADEFVGNDASVMKLIETFKRQMR